MEYPSRVAGITHINASGADSRTLSRSCNARSTPGPTISETLDRSCSTAAVPALGRFRLDDRARLRRCYAGVAAQRPEVNGKMQDLVYQDSILTLHWDQDLRYHIAHWQGFGRGETLRNALRACMEAARTSASTRWLADVHEEDHRVLPRRRPRLRSFRPTGRRDGLASGHRNAVVELAQPTPCARDSRRANPMRGRRGAVTESSIKPGKPEQGRLVRFFEGRFTILFFALIALFLVSPYANTHEAGAWAAKLIFVFLMVVTTRSVRGSRRRLIGFGLVVVFYVAASIVAPFFISEGMAVVERCAGALFCIVAIVAISLDVFDQRRPVTQDTILGAVSIYLLVAVFFGLLYRMLTLADAGALYHAHQAAAGNLPDFESLYFSFVTLTTLGFGDITPVSPYARTFAMLESVVGILYLATLVSRLVAAHKRAAHPESG